MDNKGFPLVPSEPESRTSPDLPRSTSPPLDTEPKVDTTQPPAKTPPIPRGAHRKEIKTTPIPHPKPKAPAHTASIRTRSDTFDASTPRIKDIIICLYDAIVFVGLSLIRNLHCMCNDELVQFYHCFPDVLSRVAHDPRVENVDVCSHYMEKSS